jgi:hypothetical protein
MNLDPARSLCRGPLIPALLLALGLCWTVAIRVPLVVNAADHLDSDLAVDGLTLLDSVEGRWRWHYPGTPYMGILPVLFSYPQALFWGANPVTLVSGGVAIWVFVVASAFWLAWRMFGPWVAVWAALPLVFSSLGTIWLSGRITGGHLLTLVWLNLALVGLHRCWTSKRQPEIVALGVWCGLGLYLDSMFVFTIAGVVLATVMVGIRTLRRRNALVPPCLFSIALLVGFLPGLFGRWVDPYDAYPAQFGVIFQPAVLSQHARLLALHCLPRLVAGGELYEIDRLTAGAPRVYVGVFEWAIVLTIVGCGIALIRVALAAVLDAEPARKAVCLAACVSSLLIVLAFLINRNIFNSDNYRYLIYLLTPWSLGFGLAMEAGWRRGGVARAAALLVSAGLIAGMTLSTYYWYRDNRHYVDRSARVVRLATSPWSDLVVRGRKNRAPGELTGVYQVPREVTHVFGGYWDVYRMAFLSGNQVRGIPFPMYPNRFRGWSKGLGIDQGELLILQPTDDSAGSERPASEAPPERVRAVRSASRIGWRPALETVWRSDGRDVAELDQIRVVVP